MQRRIRQLYYGRIVAFVSVLLIITAAGALYFGTIVRPSILLVSSEPVYFVVSPLRKDADVQEQIGLLNSKGYDAALSSDNSALILSVFFSYSEAKSFSVNFLEQELETAIIEHSTNIQLSAFDTYDDNKRFSALALYPLYTIKKLKSTAVLLNSVPELLTQRSVNLIKSDMEAVGLDTVRLNATLSSIYARLIAVFEQYMPKHYTEQEITKLICALSEEYFICINQLF